MPYPLQPFYAVRFDQGFSAANTPLGTMLDGYAAEGSSNAMWLGDGYWKIFKGINSQGGNTGSRIMKPVGKTWGGIKDIGIVAGSGCVIEDVGRSLWGIGSGQVHVEGTNISGFTLSTLLKVAVLASGAYSSPVTAGLGQPSAPDVGISAAVGSPTGAISCKIERRRPSTGGRSLASPTSAVIVPQGNQVRVTFPAALAGQTTWRVYFTISGFGGQGIHYGVAYPSGASGSLDISETNVAAGTVDGIARSLLFDWKDGDLVPEEASFDDYAPPAATHAMKLENVMNLAGAYADSVSSPTTTNTGTAIAVSKPNNYESYVPTHLLFLPEQVVDALARPIDSYGLVACQNSVHAIQYVGPRDDELPACTITTILPDIGILYPHNWVQFRGRVALYTAEGNLLLMAESGEMDTTWAAKIRKYIKGWDPATTVLGYDPKNDCIVLMNGKTAFCYSLQTEQWSLPIFLQDFGFTTQTFVSCQNAKRRLYVSLIDGGGNYTAYEWDNGAAGRTPVSFVSHYTQNPSPGLAKNINQLSVAIETDKNDTAPVVCISRNLSRLGFRNISAGAASNAITDTDGFFTSRMDGKQFALFGPGIGGAGVDYITGVFHYLTPGTGTLLTPIGGAQNSAITQTGLLMFIGDFIGTNFLGVAAADHLPDFFPNVPDCKSFAFGCWFQAQNENYGSLLDAYFYGSVSGTGRTV